MVSLLYDTFTAKLCQNFKEMLADGFGIVLQTLAYQLEALWGKIPSVYLVELEFLELLLLLFG